MPRQRCSRKASGPGSGKGQAKIILPPRHKVGQWVRVVEYLRVGGQYPTAKIIEVIPNNFTGEHAYLVSPSGKDNDRLQRPYFESETMPVPVFRMLPTEELVDLREAHDSNRMKELIIGGMVDPEARTILFVRGDGKNIIVPFSDFYSFPGGTQPDFDRLSFTDHGLTVCLGEYESASETILYKCDDEVA